MKPPNYKNAQLRIKMITLSILLCISVNLSVKAQLTTADEDNDYINIFSGELMLKIKKDPWHISVFDKHGRFISGEKENQVFLFGEDRITSVQSYESLGYDTIVKRDPPFYHLYDESVIIGETYKFYCNTTKSKNAVAYITFRNAFVFSVWMTMPDTVKPVIETFVSSKDEHFFGLGECWDAKSLDLKGLSVTMQNSRGTPDQGGYVPFYISTKGYGILIDNNLDVNFDFTDSSEVTITTPPISNSEDGAGYFNGSSLLWYFHYGPDLLDVISRFTEHVSRPALPPSWALFTTWQWRDFIDEGSTYDDAHGMRDEKIPCGLIWIDRPWALGNEGMPPPFEWEKSSFPNGSKMFKDLQDMGYKTGVWVARNLYGSFSDSSNYEKLKNDTKTFIKRDNCQMYKIDRGNVQNSDPLFTCQAYYEAWNDVLRGDFVTLPRTIANRAQQYVSGKWPGDNDNTYEYPSGLKANIAVMLNLAIAGFPFSGGDTGGYPDPPGNNVTARWAQVSCFCTIFETAGTPYNYPEKYRDIYRKYAEIYTRLFPYRWTYARIAHEKGYPVTRALALEYPNDPEGYNRKFEYLFGDWILVAPVVDESFSRDIYLPEGVWYDWWDGTKHQGPKNINDYNAPEDKIPLFVKSGAIIPLINVQQTWLNSSTDTITFRIYPTDSSFFQILSDTIVYTGRNKPYSNLTNMKIECYKTPDKIQIVTDKSSRYFIFEIHKKSAPDSVYHNEKKILFLDEKPDPSAINEGWYYDENNGGITWVMVQGNSDRINDIIIY